MTPSLRDLRDLANLLSHSVGPLVGATHGGGAHGGAVVLADGAMPMEAMAKPSDVLYRTTATLRL